MKLTPAEDWGRFSAYSEIIKDAERRVEDRIIKLIDEFIENSDYPEAVSALELLQDAIKGDVNA